MMINDLCRAAEEFGVSLGSDFKEVVLGRIRRCGSVNPLEALSEFMSEYARLKRKKRWGIKQPHGILDVPRLIAFFPGLKVVHIVRDPRSTVACRAKGEQGDASWENVLGVLRMSYSWKKLIREARNVALLFPDSILEIQYERLVQDPQRTLVQVCDFLEECYDPLMLDYHRSGVPYVPRDKNGTIRASHRDVALPIHARELAVWRRILTPREVSIVEEICRDEMTQWNYQKRGTVPVAHLHFALMRTRLSVRLLRQWFRDFAELIFHTTRKITILPWSVLRGRWR